MDRYAVIGNPVAHSLSPEIHRYFAMQAAQSISYERKLIDINGFRDALLLFRQQGGRGLNVTAPFKTDAYACMDILSARARQARAVNTVVLQEDGLYWGDNTDGIGFLRDVNRRQPAAFLGKRVLVIGAGGAARGILTGLLAEGPAELRLFSQTPGLAAQVIDDIAAPLLQQYTVEGFQEEPFDWVINAAGVHGAHKLPASVLHTGAFCYDLSYAKSLTPFLRWASDQGVSYLQDGLGMLIEQAAESFFIWRGVMPDTCGLIAHFRQEFAQSSLAI